MSAIAASVDKTGSAALGGDWNLEYATGQVTHFAFGAGTAYGYLLGAPTLTNRTISVPSLTSVEDYLLDDPSTVGVVDYFTGASSATILSFKVDGGATDFGVESSLLKMRASDVAMRITTDAVQLHGGYGYIKDFRAERLMRDAKITHLLWNWEDLVEGNEIHMTNNADQSRTMAFIAMRENKLYIIEGTVPKGYPEPGLFQQSLSWVDKDGKPIRYQQIIYSNAYHGMGVYPVPPVGGGGPASGVPAGGAAR